MTHLELQTALGDEFEVDEVRYPLTARTRHLNQAIHELELELDTQWGQATDELVTVASQQDYDPIGGTEFAAGSPQLVFTHPVGIIYQNSDGAQQEVQQITWQEMRATYPLEADEGAPKHFAHWAGKIWIGPIPDAIYTLYVDYVGFQTALSAAGDTNPWTLYAHEVVLYRAAIRGCAYLLEDERIPVFKRLADEAYIKLAIHLSQLEQSARRPESEEY